MNRRITDIDQIDPLEALARTHPDLHALVRAQETDVTGPRSLRALHAALCAADLAHAIHRAKLDGFQTCYLSGWDETLAACISAGIKTELPITAWYTDNQSCPVIPRAGNDTIPIKPQAAIPKTCAGACIHTGGVPTPETEHAYHLIDISHTMLSTTLPEHLACQRTVYVDAIRLSVEQTLNKLPQQKRCILFCGIFAYFNFNKFSRELRKKGFTTCFMSLNASNHAHHENDFDAIVNVGGSVDLFFWVLQRFDFWRVHFQGWQGLHCFAAVAALTSRSPLIVEFNDLPQLFMEPHAFDAAFGHTRYTTETTAITIAAAHSAGTICNHAAAAGPLLKRHLPARHTLHFHSFPQEDLFTDAPCPDGTSEVRLAFAGTLNPTSHPSPAFGDVQLLPLIKMLTYQKICFDIYLNPYQKLDQTFWDYCYLAHTSELFSIHEGMAPDKIRHRLATYHFGSMLYAFPQDCVVLDHHLRYILPTKFFSYLEAGLPVLVSEELDAVAEIVSTNKLGLVFNQNDLPRIGSLLQNCDYGAMRAQVSSYRKANSLRRRIPKLVDFYSRCSANRPRTDTLSERPDGYTMD